MISCGLFFPLIYAGMKSIGPGLYRDIPAITLVFDCEKMEYISSSGLRIILTAHKKVTAKGGKFIVRNLTREVRSVIDLTGFSRILTIE